MTGRKGHRRKRVGQPAEKRAREKRRILGGVADQRQGEKRGSSGAVGSGLVLDAASAKLTVGVV